MLKLLLISDSHGRVDRVRRAIAMHPDVDVMAFLGDGLEDFDDATQGVSAMCLCVRGNCDRRGMFRGFPVKYTEQLSVLGHRLLFVHGDAFGVKHGWETLAQEAEKRGADIVIYGHTHVPQEKYLSSGKTPVWLFCPGSIGEGENGRSTFGILTLTEDGGVLFSHADIR